MHEMKHRLIKTLCFAIIPALLGGCNWSWLPFVGGPPDTQYTVAGLEQDQETREYLQETLKEQWEENLSDTSLEDQPFREPYLERVVRKKLVKALEAKGYYNATVGFEDAEEKLTGTYHVTPGERFTISELKVKPDIYSDSIEALTIKEGDPLVASKALRQQDRLVRKVRQGRCFFDLEARHAVFLNKETGTARLLYILEDGPEVKFGETVFKGMDTVKTEYLQMIVPWEQGECFKRAQIETMQSRLLSSGLFSKVDISMPDRPDPGAEVPVTIHLVEREHRTVRAGVSYYTDEGVGVQVGWTHRNIFGKGERLDADFTISEVDQLLEVDLNKPYFFRKDQTLNIKSSIGREFTDAYVETGFETSVNIEKEFHDNLSGSTGVSLNLTQIDDEIGETQNFGLVSFPQTLTFDNRENPLDPVSSWYFRGSAEPFYDVGGESNPFFKLSFQARHYINLGSDMILALRGRVGSIVGDSLLDIPATERFYAGGGGSVRGFGYQDISPTIDGVPSGGRSLVETSTEFRFKVTEDMGGVAFVDAGQVGIDTSPDLGDPSVGAGVGFRYYTDFGPLRFDVATPLTNRDDTSNYQIYISIGQAF